MEKTQLPTVHKYVEMYELWSKPEEFDKVFSYLRDNCFYQRRDTFRIARIDFKKQRIDCNEDSADEVFKPFEKLKYGYFLTDEMIPEKLIKDKHINTILDKLYKNGAFTKESKYGYCELNVHIDW